MQHVSRVLAVKIPFLVAGLSLLVAWLLFPIENSFPMVPVVVFFVGVSSLVYFLRKQNDWFNTSVYVGILILSAFLLVRANEFIQFIDFVFIILLGSLLILPLTPSHALSHLLLTPISVLSESLRQKNVFSYSWSFFQKLSKFRVTNTIMLSIIVTLFFVFITTLLLSSANPFFNQLVDDTLGMFNLTYIFNFLESERIVRFLARVIVLIFLLFFIPRILTVGLSPVKIGKSNFALPINYLIPKVAMGVLLVVFFFTQAQLYFATPEMLASMGYTNSRLTNEVFFQVTVVAMIIFFIAYLDQDRKKWHRWLTYILVLEAFFLVGIAFKSVFDYSTLWGLTQKRLWGYATMTWLTGALLIFLYYYTKRLPVFRFLQIIVLYTIVVLIGVNISNFDYLIAHSSSARTQSGTDYVYLSRLSADSRSYINTLDNLLRQIEEESEMDPQKISAAFSVIGKINSLQEKYKNGIPFNSFNYSEYREYLNVQNLNTESYKQRLIVIEQKYSPPETMPQSSPGTRSAEISEPSQ